MAQQVKTKPKATGPEEDTSPTAARKAPSSDSILKELSAVKVDKKSVLETKKRQILQRCGCL